VSLISFAFFKIFLNYYIKEVLIFWNNLKLNLELVWESNLFFATII